VEVGQARIRQGWLFAARTDYRLREQGWPGTSSREGSQECNDTLPKKRVCPWFVAGFAACNQKDNHPYAWKVLGRVRTLPQFGSRSPANCRRNIYLIYQNAPSLQASGEIFFASLRNCNKNPKCDQDRLRELQPQYGEPPELATRFVPGLYPASQARKEWPAQSQ
jgi:hypothetical protein